MEAQPLPATKKRVEILDILRGFALLGILYTNVLFFSGYEFMPKSLLGHFPAYNETLYALVDFVFISKFYTLFSLLFGVGFFILMQRFEDKEEFSVVYKKRMYVLFLFGLVHSLLIWNGDILTIYALLGLILLNFRDAGPRVILHTSLGLLLFFVALDLLLMAFLPGRPTEQTTMPDPSHLDYPDMTGAQVLEAFQAFTIPSFYSVNTHNLVWKWIAYAATLRPFTLLGLFLLGHYLASKKFFTQGIYNYTLLFVSLIAGVLATLYANHLSGSSFQFPPTLHNTLYKLMDLIGQMGLCLFYIAAIAQLCRNSLALRFFSALIPPGKMALSCYLLQSVLSILTFNVGQLFGSLSLLESLLIATVINILVILIAHYWIAKYHMGPLEKVWRRLYYSTT